MKFKRKTFLIVPILAACAAIAFFFLKPSDSSENHVDVRVDGDTILYDGPMASDGVEQVKKLYTENIKRLVLNSPGGEINIGMDLGEWVFDHKLDVEIKSHAFSSAANYVFTAGRHKYLHKDSMVGWHGGVTQDNDSLFFKLFMKRYIEEGKTREKQFFEKIGVDQRSTVYGQRPEFEKYADYVGWTYSLAAMEQLGIKNIELLDGEWTPPDTFEGKKIFTVTEIVPL